jgi:hypothetical protein
LTAPSAPRANRRNDYRLLHGQFVTVHFAAKAGGFVHTTA